LKSGHNGQNPCSGHFERYRDLSSTEKTVYQLAVYFLFADDSGVERRVSHLPILGTSPPQQKRKYVERLAYRISRQHE
jgi:hypothetical protein